MKYLKIYLAQYVHDPCTKDYKTLEKGIAEVLHNWIDVPFSYVEHTLVIKLVNNYDKQK